MPKRTVFLLITLGVITVGLLAGAFWAKNGSKPPTVNQALQNKIISHPSLPKTATVGFAPSQIQISKGTTTQTASITIDTGTSQVTGVQIDMNYDPKVISNLTIQAPQNSLFGANNAAVLINSVNRQKGHVFYALAIPPQGMAKSGKGSVANLSFTVAPNTTAPLSTMTFTEHTLVTVAGQDDSVLKSALPLTLVFNQ